MKNFIKLTLMMFALALASCSTTEDSIQKYYVDNQDNKNFISVDLPASIISLKDGVPAEAKEALNSFEKINVLAFKIDGENQADYASENQKVKKILKSNRFSELMRVSDKGKKFVVKYEGDENTKSFDEVILYANDKSLGFALVRVIGDDMKPEKLLSLLDNIKDIDNNDSGVEQLESFFKGFKD